MDVARRTLRLPGLGVGLALVDRLGVRAPMPMPLAQDGLRGLLLLRPP
jgi:hypothetical protein